MSHLMGRCHIQRLSELGLNAEEENRVLRELAEKAFEKKEEQKRKAKSMNQKRIPKSKAQMKVERNGKTTPSSTPSESSKCPIPDETGSESQSKCPSPGVDGSDRQSEGDSVKSDMMIGSSSNGSSQS